MARKKKKSRRKGPRVRRSRHVNVAEILGVSSSVVKFTANQPGGTLALRTLVKSKLRNSSASYRKKVLDSIRK